MWNMTRAETLTEFGLPDVGGAASVGVLGGELFVVDVDVEEVVVVVEIWLGQCVNSLLLVAASSFCIASLEKILS